MTLPVLGVVLGKKMQCSGDDTPNLMKEPQLLDPLLYKNQCWLYKSNPEDFPEGIEVDGRDHVLGIQPNNKIDFPDLNL